MDSRTALFPAYLRGMETLHVQRPRIGVLVFPAYLRGMETFFRGLDLAKPMAVPSLPKRNGNVE